MVLELVQVYPPKISKIDSILNVQWTNIASELNAWGRRQTLKRLISTLFKDTQTLTHPLRQSDIVDKLQIQNSIISTVCCML